MIDPGKKGLVLVHNLIIIPNQLQLDPAQNWLSILTSKLSAYHYYNTKSFKAFHIDHMPKQLDHS